MSPGAPLPQENQPQLSLSREPLSLETISGVAAAAAVLSLFVGAALRVFGVPGALAAALALGLGGAGVALALRRIPAHLRRLTARPWVRVGYLLLLLVTVVQTARLSLFVADLRQPQHSMQPSSPWITSHSCATAYYEAARLLRDERPANIYDGQLYAPQGVFRFVAGLKVDNYEYTPAFLLAPRALMAGARDYVQFRALWALLMVATLVLALVAVVLWLPPESAGRVALASPLVTAALPTMVALQIGNVHLTMIALGVLAMMAIEGGHPAIGGTLLGYSILSKISPGILVVYLACRRQWSGILWTAAASLVLLALSLRFFGLDPWTAFFSYQMPRLENGAAFPNLLTRGGGLSNHSIPGVLYKLKALGMVAAVSVPLMRVVGWVYTAAVVAVAVVVSRRPMTDRLQRVCFWLVLMTLAGLRSVFIPIAYGTFAPLWLAALLIAAPGQGRRFIIATAVAIAGLGLLYLPTDAPHVPFAVVATATQLLSWLVVGLGLAFASRSPVRAA